MTTYTSFNDWLEKEYPQTCAMKDADGVRYWVLLAENAWKASASQMQTIDLGKQLEDV